MISVTSGCGLFGFVNKRPRGFRDTQGDHRYPGVILPKESDTELFVLIPSLWTELRGVCLEVDPKENPNKVKFVLHKLSLAEEKLKEAVPTS